MAMVGTTGTVAVGACITIRGCMEVGGITTLGTPVITDTDMVVGMIPGGVMVATVAVTEGTMDIMVITTAMEAVGVIMAEATERWEGMLFPETVIRSRTANATSFRT